MKFFLELFFFLINGVLKFILFSISTQNESYQKRFSHFNQLSQLHEYDKPYEMAGSPIETFQMKSFLKKSSQSNLKAGKITAQKRFSVSSLNLNNITVTQGYKRLPPSPIYSHQKIKLNFVF